MTISSKKRTRVGLRERAARLGVQHQRGILRFDSRLMDFEKRGLLTEDQLGVIEEHVIRLGERDRNPANTGNIEDLFCYTLSDTKSAIRAFAQALADSIKVVPMDEEARLVPPIRSLDGRKTYSKVGDFTHLNAGDRMLVTHTMAAYGDDEQRASAEALIRATHPDLGRSGVERELAKMAVQSQHHPSSSFVLARAQGLTIDLGDLYETAGYSKEQIRGAQRFYDICAEYRPDWAADFLTGEAPVGQAWEDWRGRYLEARRYLPLELVYQLASDTLTNFLEGTLESGKWTDACVMFGGVTDPREVPAAIARIVNQYIAEHTALHDGKVGDLTLACADTLKPWGIGFEDDRAVVIREHPEKSEALLEQFEAAWGRKRMG